MMESPWTGKTALITGASSGIGAALADWLASKGLHVALTARRGQRLKEVASAIEMRGGKAWVHACDISQAGARERLVSSLKAEFGSVDILINNAGFGWYGYFHHMNWGDAKKMLAVNVEAAAQLSHLLLPGMLSRGSGHIINISSIAGGLPNQGIAMYAGSKAFLDAFTTVLHRELRGSGVHVSSVRLGPVRTEFYDQARGLQNGGPVPAERFVIPVERVNHGIWRLLNHPHRVMYLPGWLAVTRVVEPLFGGLIDRLGPMLLKRSGRKRGQ